MRKLLFSNEKYSSFKLNLGLLVLRVSFGLMIAFAHGLVKFPVPDFFVKMVGSFGFPMPSVFAWAAVISEFIGGMFIALGLGTRVFSLLIMSTMTVAAYSQWVGEAHRFEELAYLYFMGAFSLFFMGAGRFSIDGLINRD